MGVILALSTAPATAQVVNTSLWVPNGQVNAIVRDGNTIYIGGDFTVVGPSTGNGVPLSSATGEPIQPFSQVDGFVRAAIPDGSGGWFVGGWFGSVGGLPRSNLAHILADGSVADWMPNPDGEVFALAESGNVVYASGWFSSIGGQARNHLAAVDATTGMATDWNSNTSGHIVALAVSGSVVYVGGGFSSMGGQTRNSIAALDAATGAVTEWDPNACCGNDDSSVIYTLAVSGNVVYVGGTFTSIGGQTRYSIAALDVVTGAATAWNPNANGGVAALAVSGNLVYAAGTFTSIGGQSRSCIAALDVTTGVATDWDPSANSGSQLNALAVNGGVVYVGGQFTSIGGQTRPHLAALDAATGAATAWNPNAGGTVWTLAASGSAVFAGGLFTTVGGQARANIAAFDAVSSSVSPWDPRANGRVQALAVSNGVVYAVGDFSGIGGQARHAIAALDPVTGTATDWNPGVADSCWEVCNCCDGSCMSMCCSTFCNRVATLVVSGATVYIGGIFNAVGGQPRRSIAALDAATGAVTAWNPNADGEVVALAASGSTVYASGFFSNIGGQPRFSIAALDVATGAATPWNANANGYVRALSVSGNVVYAGGQFTVIGGQTRNLLAALDATTGAATPWNPNADVNWVAALAVYGSVVYAGGGFYNIGGQARTYLAALDATSGAATAWNADLDNGASAILATGRAVYVGGGFQTIGGKLQPRFAEVSSTVGPPDPSPSIVSAIDIPNDQGGWIRVTFGRSFLDDVNESGPVATYGVWRRVPGTIAARADRARASGALDPPPVANDTKQLRSLLAPSLEAREVDGRLLVAGAGSRSPGIATAFPPGTWELVTSVPAVQKDQYVVAAPTISNAAPCDYVVTAHTTTPSIWYISGAMSGQSVDNLAPAQPTGLTAAYTGGQGNLQWAANTEADLASYRLYRGASADFAPSPGNQIAAPTSTRYTDVSATGGYYKLSALDVNGNESGFALATAVAFALEGARPNPTGGSALQVAFALPTGESASLELYDVSGRRVLTREVGSLGVGRHTVNLTEGQHVPAGIYWLSLSQGGNQQRIRVAVIQ